MTNPVLERNFLFFLNQAHPLSIEDSLAGALAKPSSWEAVAGMVRSARQKDAFVRSVQKLQLYVHVPFCGRLCSFCHCAKSLLRRRSDIDVYIKSLLEQMALQAPVYRGMDAATLCFGGGSPSILDERQIDCILDGADSSFPAPKRKILFEINPSSWNSSKLKVLLNRGLFRLSIGVQSLDEKVLQTVARAQTRKKVMWCISSAKKARVPHINVDFIAGLPGQTSKGLAADIRAVIDEGVDIVHVHPYCGSSLKDLCAPQETVPAFFKRRDKIIKAAREVLEKSGFKRHGLGAYTLHQAGEDHQEEAYCRLESAVAAFGPSAKGQVPGAVYYRVGPDNRGALPAIEASGLDRQYAMGHYASIALLERLDEMVFKKRFGVSLDAHCGQGLKYLKEAGLVNSSNGVWKFSGSWDIARLREYVALSRVLLGEDILIRLHSRLAGRYDPKEDYSGGPWLLKAYANSWLMVLYYQMGV